MDQPQRLILIAVSVEDGTSQSTVRDANGNIILAPDKPLRVMGFLDSARFDAWVQNELQQPNPQIIKPHVHRYPDGTSPFHVGTILFTHNSPGQVCVDFNGVPICYP